MRIQHNISALNTHRNLAFNNAQASKNLEKLSSGYKINRAGDDAAGLAISEKMRGQIRGLDMAQKNAQDGVSLIQTAEGALHETHAILQRMRELSVQSANDTNMSEVDREAMQEEVNALIEEIDGIAQRTEFNTQKLIDGTFKDKKFHIGANETQNLEINIDKMNASGLKIDGLKVSSGMRTSGTAATSGTPAASGVSGASGTPATSGTPGTPSGVKDEGILTQGKADAAIKTIDEALNQVSTQRSKLGAIQNRLEHTINNLGASSENLTAAESRIRDTDMAKEMMGFTKNNILMQAAQSMLAQANQQPQGVLQLLG